MNVLRLSLVFSLLLRVDIVLAQENLYTRSDHSIILTEKGASYLTSLPLKCLEKEYPYKTGISFLDSTFITPPKDYHPAFYGCYDWHSSVH